MRIKKTHGNLQVTTICMNKDLWVVGLNKLE